MAWLPDEKLLSVRRFRMNDEPNAREPSKEEADKTSKETKHVVPAVAVPKHFQESRLKDARMEKANMSRIREKENTLRKRLMEMNPDSGWSQPIAVYFGDKYALGNGSESLEREKQKQREAQVFVAHYAKV